MDAMKNFKEIKTTILGFIILIASGFYFALPYFSEKELWEVSTVYVIGGIVAGILLLLAPDKFVDFLFSWANKKSGADK